MKFCLLYWIISISIVSIHKVTAQDSLFRTATEFGLIQELNSYLQTNQPVGYGKIDKKGIRFDYRFDQEMGKFYPINQARENIHHKISLEGYDKINKVNLYGKASYSISDLKQQKWNNVLFVNPHNPFTLGDSTGGDYDREIFSMEGAVITSINQDESLTVGLFGKYSAGNNADQTDPRPLMNAIRYTIRPGVTYEKNNWLFGANLTYEGYRENISISSVNSNWVHHFFLFQGLGNAISRTGTGYSRRYDGNGVGGDLQIAYNTGRLDNIVEIGYLRNKESARDGSVSSFFKAGNFEESSYHIANIASFRQDKQTTHQLHLKGDYNPTKGIWFDQIQMVDGNAQHIWQVYNQSVKHKENTVSADFKYVFWRKAADLDNSYILSLSGKYRNSETNHYPEGYFQKYATLFTQLNAKKWFKLKDITHLVVAANAGYRSAISKQSDFAGIQLNDLYSYPLYDYLTAEFWQAQLSVELNRRLNLNGFSLRMFIVPSFNYIQTLNDTPSFRQKDRSRFEIAVGFIF
ncbi:hypothetical protein FAZ15_20000 [Sphingobacterium olei]|uniref:DUF6850 domain-containing protein n=1 Tax=Sphingobacterium olei TaxID=2571155 RepID=A0A4U0NDG4_9SPHI|nr:DUF6850 family outer membrane beta-barrel protein [Sphingobacterium olei]TJZ51833.1 hypothetical protein FAZ15_20000 [Sphingobacterium olei]